jgi:hypothetical protein
LSARNKKRSQPAVNSSAQSTADRETVPSVDRKSPVLGDEGWEFKNLPMPGFLDPQLFTEFPFYHQSPQDLNSQGVFRVGVYCRSASICSAFPSPRELIRLAGATFLILGIVLIRT